MDPNLHRTYLNATPFPHIAIDNYFNTGLLIDVESEMATFREWDGEKNHYGSQKKRYCGTRAKLPPKSKLLIDYLNSSEFLPFLEGITGIQGLVPDPYLEGGGLHQILPGGFLKVHADFNWHSKLRLYRRINLLLYLNSGWDPQWGGELQLWDKSIQNCVASYPPQFNKLIIFETNDNTFHGHPEPLRCPEHVKRNSIALYYYTSERGMAGLLRGKSIQTDYRSCSEGDVQIA